VITRMESFYGEHEIILNGLGNGLDIETASLVQRGWQMPYHHPKYPGQKDINAGSVYQCEIDPKEKKILTELNTKKVNTYFYFGYGPQVMFAPLLGIPYPILTWKRLQQLRSNGIRHLAHLGGTAPPDQVPYNINHLMVRTFQFNPDTEPESFLHRYATRQAGKTMAPRLLKAWKLTEEAILGFPVITSLYATIGFTWYRLWARPLVPDIEKIDPEKRRYYEDFMCTTPHNPNNVDLSRDVLFKLTTPEKCSEWIPLMDARVFPPLDEAISLLAEATSGICYDQRIRLQALRCWMMTQRNVASWISTVYGYLQTKDPTEKQQFQSALKDTIHREIENSRDLISLFDSSITFLALTDQGETELVYGTNLKELLVKRIRLMEDHLNDKPFIDMNYTERKAGETIQ
ncbi:MAG: hypothetical protein J7L89_06640, partial [Bacteroidales bacterium]|nr:hypothetical protein [Bacteroidales bacterium]